MSWPADITEGLPGPRGDEPADLRRNIVDELADHLGCAMTHELHRTKDETEARRNVLKRFGDPKRIAYRLWFDAMKEKVMSQRIMLVAVIVLAVVCLASVVFSWMSLQDTRAFNQAMVEKLAEMASRPQATAPSGLGTVKVRLVEGSPNGKPVANQEVWLEGNLISQGETAELSERTNDEGIVVFGPIQPSANHYVRVRTLRGYYLLHGLKLFPGETKEMTLVCPAGSFSPLGSVSIQLDLPAELSRENIAVTYSFSPVGDEQVRAEGFLWNRSAGSVLLRPTGELITDPDQYRLVEGGQYRSFLTGSFFTANKSGTADRFFVPAGQYRLGGIEILARDENRSPEERTYRSVGTHRYESEKGLLLEVKPGELNTWRIELPETLLEQARRKLAARAEEESRRPSLSLRGAPATGPAR